MTNKNKFILFFISELLFLIIFLILIPAFFIKERPGIHQTSIQKISSFDSKHSFVQKFTTDQSNLNSVSVLLKNPSLSNQSQITLEVLDNHQQVLKTLNSSGVSIGDPSWLTFKFPYINSKIGDQFFIKLTTDNQKSDTLFVYSDQDPNSFNFKTTYTSTSLKDSLKISIDNQVQRFQQRNIFYNLLYIFLFLGLNIFLFINL